MHEIVGLRCSKNHYASGSDAVSENYNDVIFLHYNERDIYLAIWPAALQLIKLSFTKNEKYILRSLQNTYSEIN